MTFNARSNSGCWTCRLRKKKCDEDRPACSICQSLSLPCHGYGPRPTWMDGGSEERKMAESFRHIVKQSNRQKRQAQLRQREPSPYKHGRVVDKQIITSPASVAESNISRQTQSTSTVSLVSPTTSSKEYQPPASISSRLEDEQVLLMHYLDHVFVQQFPFYDPTIKEGGRGWLLSILMRTKPLYYAALTLAAYHQQVSMCTATAATALCTLDELLENHILAMSELRRYLIGCGAAGMNDSISRQVENLASMALLISLEVIRGNTEHWVMHLDAAIAVIHGMPVDDIELLSTAYRTALNFFYSVIGWYDTLSCATTRRRTFSASEGLTARLNYLGSDRLMGCEEWVMVYIREIASLKSDMDLKEKDGKSIKDVLVCAGDEIQMHLNKGLHKNLSSLQNHPKDATWGHVRGVLTQIFACSALVYLHVTVLGAFPELSEIRQSVRRTVDALELLPTKELVQNLAWPLCIAGCMALPEERKFFRELIATTSAPAKRFGNADKVLEIMEECWRLRDSQDYAPDGVCWTTAMEVLGLSIMLV